MNTNKDRQEIANNDLRQLNNIGKRITWCREQLKLSRYEVAKTVGISPASYFGRELGVRTYYHEEYKALAGYFNEKWKNKFKEQFPSYEGMEIRKVKTMWIMFGEMDE